MRVVITTAAWSIMALWFTIVIIAHKWDDDDEDQWVRVFAYGILLLFWLVAFLVPFTYSRLQRSKPRTENDGQRKILS